MTDASTPAVPRWAVTLAIAAAVAALVAWSAWQRWAILTETPFPVGIDGYFYPIQLRSLLEHGHLAYPASPLAFWLMAPLAAATDPMTGAKLGAALLTALVAIPAYGCGARLGRGRGAGLLAAAIAATSAGSAFLCVEFVKNGAGITVGLATLWLVLRALERASRGRVVAAIAGVVAAYLAHKMAAALVLAIAIPAALAEASDQGALRGRRLIYAIGALAGLAIVLLALGLAFPERFLSPADLGHAVWGPAHWDLPALATPAATLAMGHEALLGAIAAVAAAAVLVVGGQRARQARRAQRASAGDARRSRGERVACWGVIGLGLAVAVPWLAVADPQGVGFRLRIVAFVPLSLAAAIASDVLRMWRVPYRDLALAGLALVIVVLAPRDRAEGRVLAHPAMVAAAMGLAGKIPDGGIAIVPERHIEFMIAWYTGVPTRQRPEGVPAAQRYRVMPLAFIGLPDRDGRRSPLDHALLDARGQPGLRPPVGTHPRDPDGLVVVPEATWVWALGQLPPDVREHYRRWRTI